MAIMVPKDCVDSCPISQVLYKQLQTQLGDNDQVVQYLLPHVSSVKSSSNTLEGSLFWVQNGLRSIFVYLANSVEKNIDVAMLKQTGLDGLASFLKQEEVSQLLLLQKQLLPKELASYRSKIIPFLVINPYKSNKQFNLSLKKYGLYFAGQEIIKSSKLGVLVHKLLGIPASAFAHKHMRTIFSPEVVLNRLDQTDSLPLKNIHLLDFEQELSIKTNLVLRDEHDDNEICQRLGVTGGVNSGKTEVLIQRAKLIKKISPDSKVIIITANNFFQQSLQSRFKGKEEHSFEDSMVDIYSFTDWCKRELKSSKHLIDESELEKIIDSRLKKQLEAIDIKPSIFMRELAYIYGRKIFYENEYYLTKDTKRSYEITEEQYSHIWKAHFTLKNELSMKGWLFPLSLPQQLFDAYQENGSLQSYDYILVDDAHLLPPIAFELLEKVLESRFGQLFITQNLKQGSVGECGDLPKQNIHLQNHYEINPAILNASYAFLHNRLPNEQNNEFFPVEQDNAEYPLPQLLHFYKENDEQNRLLNELKRKIHAGVDLTDILIVASKNKKEQLVTLIKETLDVPTDLLSTKACYSYKTKQQRTGLGICSFSDAVGLTSPFVYLFGLQDIFETENQLRLETRQYQESIIENTQLVSMLMTQAKRELTMFISANDVPEAFLSPYISTPTERNDKQSTVSSVSYLCQNVS